MKRQLRNTLMLVASVTFIVSSIGLKSNTAAQPRTVYASYTLHGNMNYDRYPKSTMWEKFPAGYDMMVEYIAESPRILQ